jgi:hypothetical protein
MSNSPNTTVKILPIQCVWGLLCSLSSIDQERNNISLFNIIDQLNIPAKFLADSALAEKPAFFHVPHEIILLWMRTLNTAISAEVVSTTCRLSLIDPRGKELQQTMAPLNLDRNIRRMRFRMRTHGLNITVPGDYIYRVEVRDLRGTNYNKVLEVPFEVVSVADNVQ